MLVSGNNCNTNTVLLFSVIWLNGWPWFWGNWSKLKLIKDEIGQTAQILLGLGCICLVQESYELSLVSLKTITVPHSLYSNRRRPVKCLNLSNKSTGQRTQYWFLWPKYFNLRWLITRCQKPSSNIFTALVGQRELVNLEGTLLFVDNMRKGRGGEGKKRREEKDKNTKIEIMNECMEKLRMKGRKKKRKKEERREKQRKEERKIEERKEERKKEWKIRKEGKRKWKKGRKKEGGKKERKTKKEGKKGRMKKEEKKEERKKERKKEKNKKEPAVDCDLIF